MVIFFLFLYYSHICVFKWKKVPVRSCKLYVINTRNLLCTCNISALFDIFFVYRWGKHFRMIFCFSIWLGQLYSTRLANPVFTQVHVRDRLALNKTRKFTPPSCTREMACVGFTGRAHYIHIDFSSFTTHFCVHLFFYVPTQPLCKKKNTSGSNA